MNRHYPHRADVEHPLPSVGAGAECGREDSRVRRGLQTVSCQTSAHTGDGNGAAPCESLGHGPNGRGAVYGLPVRSESCFSESRGEFLL